MKKEFFQKFNRLKKGDGTLLSLYRLIFFHTAFRAFETVTEDGHAEPQTYLNFKSQTVKAAGIITNFACENGVSLAGKTVALSGKNCPDYLAAFWGILLAGGEPLLLPCGLKADEINKVLADSNAVLLICDTETSVSEAANQSVGIPTICFDEPYDSKRTFKKKSVPFGDKLFLLSGGEKIVEYKGGDITAQVLRTRRFEARSSGRFLSQNQFKSLAVLPFDRILSLIMNVFALPLLHATIVFPPENSEIETLSEVSINYGITHIFAPSSFYNSLAAKVREEAAAQEERIIASGASERTVAELFKEGLSRDPYAAYKHKHIQILRSKVLGDRELCMVTDGVCNDKDDLEAVNAPGYYALNGYCKQEIGIASVETVDYAYRRILGGIGSPTKGVEFEISETSELLIKAEGMSASVEVDGDGFFHTNDVAYVDKEGVYRLSAQASYEDTSVPAFKMSRLEELRLAEKEVEKDVPKHVKNNKKKFLMFIKIFGFPFFYPYLKWKAYNKANLKVLDGLKEQGVLITMNHLGYCDPVLLALMLFFKKMWFIAANFIFANPVSTYLFHLAGATERSKDGSTLHGIAVLSKKLKEKKIAVIFPEGGIVDGNKAVVHRFKKGAAMLALETGCKVLPVYFNGNYGFFKKPIKINIGEARTYKAEDFPVGTTENAMIESVTNSIYNAVLSLKDEVDKIK
ncbi:MAG: 1-acyl-sn-glycerol-3-phosphate acyltransferase [Christensenellaceae bacterium]|jgi:1-acyl-sn-glycerol-3-phosphate acyltransferase/acyl-CoA synthetase (AMP-forming)/AMP-acid ligase II|nr:1-acyl-sn-glycerol-3-phosphate acyltransferase [Christensenellaceae bacterium]